MSTNPITISGHHIEITPALETNIQNMINKLQHKFDHITTVHVTLKIDNARPKYQLAEAELNLCGRKEPIFATASSLDMYDSIHKLKDKLDRQIVRHKELLQSHGDQNHNHNHQHQHHCQDHTNHGE